MTKKLIITLGLLTLSLAILLTGCTNKELAKADVNDTATSTVQEERNTKNDTSEDADKELMMVVESMREGLPHTTGVTRIEKVEFEKDKQLYVYITNMNISAARLEDSMIIPFNEHFTNEVKTQRNWAVFRKHSVTIHFKMHNKNKKELFEIVVTPEEYN